MSEHKLDANNLTASKDVFDKFEAESIYEEEDFITLSDIANAPQHNLVPELSDELNEIPYDNEVVLDTIDDQAQVNNHNGTGLQLLDISEKNVFENPPVTKDKESNNISYSDQQKFNRSCDGLGDQIYVLEDSSSMIQDSLLSTTLDQNEHVLETAQVPKRVFPRRTKRGRIPNTAKYPLTSPSHSEAETVTPAKRRPGRPKKIPPQTLSEPDSTNADSSLLHGTESTSGSVHSSNGNGTNELTPVPQQGKRGRPTRGRKPKAETPLTNKKLTSFQNNDNTIVDSTKPEDDSQMELDPIPSGNVKMVTPNTSKRKKAKGKKANKTIPIKITNEEESCAVDDDGDDVCLSELKKDLEQSEITSAPASEQNEMTSAPANEQNEMTSAPANEQIENTLAPNPVNSNSKLIVDDSIRSISIGDIETNLALILGEPIDNTLTEVAGASSTRRNSKKPSLPDFEYNIDKVVKDASIDNKTDQTPDTDCLLVEDTSKRRRVAKKSFVYDECSEEEDPFADVPSSDEEPKRWKKGTKYCSDDEYVPQSDGKKKGGGKIKSSSSEDSEDDIDDESGKKRKTPSGMSPFKKGRKSKSLDKSLVSTIKPKGDDADIEGCLESTVIKIDETLRPPAEAWAKSNEFQNFIASNKNSGLQIKKVSTKESIDTVVPLEIPVINQTKPKKTIEISTQTQKPSTSAMGVQTSAPYDIPMKMNVDLTPGQAEKACEFLSSVVKTTVELGHLMSQKSQDFMKKKINPANVTDTLKMDYCVRKSFLLFKLAKHNLLQMEEDLSNQYEAFLDENKLSLCREVPKKIEPKPKDDSDSDCEIVEVVGGIGSGSKPEKATPKVNPKTVFLNKELSIKIAKKTNTPEKPVPGKKKLEIKGRHAVWINKNVMVKKVNPTQSFLAQDSRNKKPPDVITKKMVSDFFESYNRKKALLTCAPFINNDWTCTQRQYVCHYFLNELDAANTVIATDNTIETPDRHVINETIFYESPKTLFSQCAKTILKCLHNKTMEIEKYTCNVTDGGDTKGPVTLFRLCLDVLKTNLHNEHSSDNVYKATDKDGTSEEIKLCDVNNTDSTEEANYCTKDYDVIDDDNENDEQELEDRLNYKAVSPLTKICYKEIVKTFFKSEIQQENHMTLILNDVTFDNDNSMESYSNIDDGIHLDDIHASDEELYISHKDVIPNIPKTLFRQCVELIQNLQGITTKRHDHYVITSHADDDVSNIKSLKSLAFEIIKHNFYPSNIEEITDSAMDNTQTMDNDNTNYENESNENFTINCINTLSEEAFDCLQEPVRIRIRKQSQDSSNFSDGFDNNEYVDHDENDYIAVNEADDNGWASQLQVQVQEFRSCFTPHVDTTESMEETHETHEPDEVIPHIKREPIEDFAEENIVDTSIVKSEPIQPMADPDQGLHALNEMTHIPDEIITKRELLDPIRADGSPLIHNSSSYNVESFEQFVNKNKMIQSTNESYNDNEIFSQSGLRIRRQHEPDLDPGHDPNMSLLVPHTFEPLHLMEAKSSLMESSSDDGTSSKKSSKKKDKRKKRNKKDVKNNNKGALVLPKEVPAVNDKIIPENEVAVLTRRMREKIRQEEKKVQTSDSDSDSYYSLASRKDKSKKDKVVEKNSGSDSDTLYMFNKIDEDIKDKTKTTKNKLSSADITKTKKKQDLVQCNNVDSTETLGCTEVTDKEKFSGFSVDDQNGTTHYQKLLQLVYNRMLPNVEDDHGRNKEQNAAEEATADAISKAVTGPIINPDEPVELLECEPTMPIFDDEPIKRPGPKKHKNKKNIETNQDKPKDDFLERHGWHCYNVNPNDPKLYANAQIILEKLPESFVEIYKEYQDVMDKDLDDHEVDRLINLQSLNRSGKDFKDIKDGKTRSKSKTNKKGSSELNSGSISRASSPTYSDHLDELVPSDDDERANPEDETAPPVPVRSSENNLAKNLLMNDPESDSDGGGKKIKEEPKDPDAQKTKKNGPKSKTKLYNQDPESLMLTADKMMNKELNLLHAPITLQEDIKTEVKDTGPKDEAKHSKKSSKRRTKDRVKNEDDSSSEEEKQWVSTKEKLLKRMGKKEDVVADDAKRAKLVNEFIERRNEAERKDKRENNQGRNRRNRKKRLERQKQLRFLSNELYNEGVDGIVTGKRGAAAGLFKGRRNIRKVIDKKSLARSTVVANMEEFERKRRLNMRQNKLREVLGCEEGVNVLVINDEVCLEYDFEEQRPVVSVHPFFTKVMKAHQYEGVKFMWDACFESLHNISLGQSGGGCILAHCMGLGKTLQVLALLHTVLTHPRANMQRVLVCCPLSTVLNWVDEIHKWIGPVTDEIKVFELSKLRKTYERAYQLEDWYNGGGIFIIGYELFRSLTTLDPEIDEIRPTIINKIRTALLDPGPDIIICDEGHLLKNDCSVLAVAMSRVVTKRRIVLTGTPMQNNLREYFCMVNFIKPNLLGTYSEFSNRFENPIMNGQHRDSREEDIKLMKARTHILHKVLEGCLQRQEASVLYPYLPKKHEYTVFIPLTKCQWELYNHYIDCYAKTQKQKHILKDFHILQKIWSHPQVLHNFHLKARDKRDKIKAEKLEDDLAIADQEADIKPAETEHWWLDYLSEGDMLDSLDSSNKFVAVFRILHECVALGDKVLIFSTSLFCLDALEYFLKKIKKWSLGQEYYRLDGSVPAEVRQKWVREFNAENNLKTKLFLISTRAGCLGLNMTAANRVIILDTSWNPAHDIQSIFRVYRFGQKKDCYIYRLVALGTMEQKIYERSVTKQAVACRVVDEQQIDRHYNLAELTELYSMDELGMSVAGGVAVGVSDVALLRVARDAAVHAVHEHDSLLRGEHEQGLPEHERAAAWSQFQLEHENKQKQNELHVKQAARVAMKRLEMDHLRQLKLQEAAQVHQPPLDQITPKTEPGYHLIEPKEEPGVKQKGGRKYKKVVQCRIPIVTTPQPGPSNTDESQKYQQQLVQKITYLLIKHKFVKQKSEQHEIDNLVAKVKNMIATGQPMALGPGYDELSSSIANVLLNPDTPMPPLTNIEQPPPAPTPTVPEEKSKRGRKKKQIVPEKPPTPPPEPEPEPEPETDGRRRRKAAIAAEKQFDSQQDVIDLDDDAADEWQADDEAVAVDDWLTDTETDQPIRPIPIQKETPAKEITRKIVPKQKTIAKDKEPLDDILSSILLSDDEGDVEVNAPAPTTSQSANQDAEVVELLPSLLTNAHFIKIVACAYGKNNPMMDKAAARLAAQYSTLKTLREAEGKPITSGPVYDIAVQALGKDVLRKLSGNPEPTPPTVAKKPKIGPKSKVKKDVKQEIISTSVKPVNTTQLVDRKPLIMTVSNATLFAPSKCKTKLTTTAAREESILPDDEVVSVPTEPPVERTPIIIKKIKLSAPSVPAATPVAMGRGPAPLATSATPQDPPHQAQPSDGTICLDSDDEDRPPVAAPGLLRRRLTKIGTGPAPVPVALTGPNAQTIKLTAPQTHKKPMYFQLSPCGTRAIPVQGPASIPLPMSSSSDPIPISLLGPTSQPTPASQAMAMHGRPMPGYFTEPSMQPGRGAPPVPISLSGPGSQPVPVSLVGPNSSPVPLQSAPVPMSLVDASGRPVGLAGMPMFAGGQAMVFASHQPPPSAPTPTTARVPIQSQPAPVKPSELLRITQSGLVEILERKSEAVNQLTMDLTTTIIDDEEPAPVAPKALPVDPKALPKLAPKPTPQLTPKIAPKPAPQLAPKPTPQLTPKIAPKPAPQLAPKPTPRLPKVSTPPPKPAEKPAKRKSRRMWSSSSSSSGRSRSSSPEDPLAILKDVVHIQAPDKPAQPEKKKVDPSPKQMNIGSYRLKYGNQKTESPRSDPKKDKNTVDLTNIFQGPGYSKIPSNKKPLDTSKPSTSRYSDVRKDASQKLTMKLDLPKPSKKPSTSTNSANSSKSSSSKQTSSMPSSSKNSLLKPSSSKSAPLKLVGTSKSIILDGKSKSLKVESKSSSLPMSSAKKQADKRPAPSTSAGAPLKKSKIMTLKDFDIDDIDDIIELD